MTTDTRTVGQVAYEAYSKSAGGKSLVSGEDLPPWRALSSKIQEAWEMAALAVLSR